MDLMSLFIKVGVKDEATSKLDAIIGAVGSGLATAAKVGTAAVAAAGAAMAKITADAVDAFANYEQLVGGVETLFGDSAKTVTQYAEDAYKTAGLSANEYMETVTSFAAALVSGLGGDTEQAAEFANMAIQDMSDNANKMGTDMSSIQNAYQGFAKQNYTMLDNLKLGYGGTASEMIRLINTAIDLDDQFDDVDLNLSHHIQKLDEVSYDQIIGAIHIVQENMGIMGTTAKEASTTIQGSVNSMKAAWKNVLVALSGGTEDFAMNIQTAISNLLDTIVGADGNGGLLANIEPVVMAILNNIPILLTGLTPILIETLDGVINNMLEPMLSAVTGIITSASGLIPSIVELLVNNAPMIMDAAIVLVTALGQGLLDNIDQIVEMIADLVIQLTDFIINNADKMIDGAVELIIALADGFAEHWGDFIGRIPELIGKLIAAIISHAPELLKAAVQLVLAFIDGMMAQIAGVARAADDIVKSIRDAIRACVDGALGWGADLLTNFMNGIYSRFSNFVGTLRDIGQTIVNWLGFSEPKEGPLSNFHTFAPDMMELFAQGIRDNEDVITAQIDRSFDFGNSIVNTPTTHTNGNESPMTIIVQSVLDGNVIGETSYRYYRKKARALGAFE